MEGIQYISKLSDFEHFRDVRPEEHTDILCALENNHIGYLNILQSNRIPKAVINKKYTVAVCYISGVGVEYTGKRRHKNCFFIHDGCDIVCTKPIRASTDICTILESEFGWKQKVYVVKCHSKVMVVLPKLTDNRSE